jgi:hypothetical protein
MKTPIVLLLAFVLNPSTAHADCTATQFATSGLAGFNERVENVRSIRLADFNGDGAPDLVVASIGGVRVFLHGGLETGNFQAPLSASSVSSYEIAVGDINGDGKQDIVSANFSSNSVTTLLGNGDGTFQATTLLVSTPRHLALGDFNGDGKLDLAVSSSTPPTLSIYLGNGDGTFRTPYTTSTPDTPLSVVAADLDGDGKVDVLTSYTSPSQIDFWRGDGNGALAAPVSLAMPPSPGFITTADLDGDGRLDVITTIVQNLGVTTPQWIAVLHNRGGGVFDAPVLYSAPSSAPYHPSFRTALPNFMVVGDFMGKSRADLALTSTEGLLTIFPSNGDGTFGTPAPFYMGVYSPTQLVALDLDGDGHLDLAVANFNVGGGVVFMNHTCGNDNIVVTRTYPTVSVTQVAPIAVSVGGYVPTGTITLREGASVIASAAPGSSAFNLSLPAGDHSLVAEYSGDLWNEPLTSTVVVQHVTTATTTTTATVTPNPTTVGTPVRVTPTVTSSNGDSPGGFYTLSVDGDQNSQATRSPLAFPANLQLVAGTHTIQVDYPGDETHPPSSAAPVTVVVDKLTLTLDVVFNPLTPKAGQQVTAIVNVPLPAGQVATGTMAIRLGGVMVGTATLSSTAGDTVQVPIGSFPAGVQSLVLSYSGDSTFAPANKPIQLTVAPGSPAPPRRRVGPHG